MSRLVSYSILNLAFVKSSEKIREWDAIIPLVANAVLLVSGFFSINKCVKTKQNKADQENDTRKFWRPVD